MRAKFARLIRIGINARCVPYKTCAEPHDSHQESGHWTVLDFTRLRENAYEWEMNKHRPLVREAWRRTKPWTSERPEPLTPDKRNVSEETNHG